MYYSLKLGRRCPPMFKLGGGGRRPAEPPMVWYMCQAPHTSSPGSERACYTLTTHKCILTNLAHMVMPKSLLSTDNMTHCDMKPHGKVGRSAISEYQALLHPSIHPPPPPREPGDKARIIAVQLGFNSRKDVCSFPSSFLLSMKPH